MGELSELHESHWKHVFIDEPAVNKIVKQIIYKASTIQGDNRIAWLLKAITCIDLTLLGGDDTRTNIETLCKKVRNVESNISNIFPRVFSRPQCYNYLLFLYRCSQLFNIHEFRHALIILFLAFLTFSSRSYLSPGCQSCRTPFFLTQANTHCRSLRVSDKSKIRHQRIEETE